MKIELIFVMVLMSISIGIAYSKDITPINESDPVYWYNKGNALVGQVKYEEAIQAYDKAIELNQSYAEAWLYKASALKHQGKHDETIKAYDEAIRLDPNDVIPWFNKGVVLYELGKLDEAIKAYDKALEIHPRDVAAWFNKGSALRHQGKYDEAIKAYKKDIELSPSDTDAWNMTAISLKALGRNSETLAAFIKEGDIQYNHGFYAEAIKSYDNAISIGSQYADDSIAWYNKANALNMLHRNSESEAAYAKARELGYNAVAYSSINYNGLKIGTRVIIVNDNSFWCTLKSDYVC